MPLEVWALRYHEHTRRDPTLTPRPGDTVDTGEKAPVYVVEGVDDAAVWVRRPDDTREAVPRADWAGWLDATVGRTQIFLAEVLTGRQAAVK